MLVLKQLNKAQNNLGLHDCFDAKELDKADNHLLAARNRLRRLIRQLSPESLSAYEKAEQERIERENAQFAEAHPGGMTVEMLVRRVNSPKP